MMQTGDVLLVKGEGFFSKIIRVFTADSFSHVAMIVIDDDEMVYEFVEGHGFQKMPYQTWRDARRHQSLYYGVAPSMEILKVKSAAQDFKFSKQYGYLSLLKVWIGQVFNATFSTRRKVCSTFVEHCWTAGGFKFTTTPDPGDFLDLCTSITPIGE